MKTLLTQMKWQLMIFNRSNIIPMVAVVTAFYGVIFYLFKDYGNIDKLLTFLIFNDPALIGFMFVGIAIILEKDQEVLPALFVTPINPHVYILSKLITLSLIGLVAGWCMVVFAVGFDFSMVHFSIGVFGVSFLFGIIGFIIVSYTTEILHYILRFFPVLLFMSLPLLNYFDLTNIALFKLFPIQGALNLIANSYAEIPNESTLLWSYVSLFFWTSILYYGAFKIFQSKIINA